MELNTENWTNIICTIAGISASIFTLRTTLKLPVYKEQLNRVYTPIFNHLNRYFEFTDLKTVEFEKNMTDIFEIVNHNLNIADTKLIELVYEYEKAETESDKFNVYNKLRKHVLSKIFFLRTQNGLSGFPKYLFETKHVSFRKFDKFRRRFNTALLNILIWFIMFICAVAISFFIIGVITDFSYTNNNESYDKNIESQQIEETQKSQHWIVDIERTVCLNQNMNSKYDYRNARKYGKTSHAYTKEKYLLQPK